MFQNISFDNGFEVRDISFDISRVFDKVWHYGLINKFFKKMGQRVDTLAKFLNDRKQRVILKGQYSTWTTVEAGDAQGSVLESLLFFIIDIYIHIYI